MLIRLAALTAAMLLTTAAHAATVELTAPVTGHPDKTYADLVGQFVEGFALDASHVGRANITTAIRYVDEAEAVPEASERPGAVKVLDLEAITMRSGGKPVLVLRVDLDTDEGGWPMVLLGTFDPDLKLIDDARVDLDRLVSVEDPMAISDKDDALLVRSTHVNAGENFESAQLVFLNGTTLTALPAFYGYSALMCGYRDTQTLAFSAADDGRPGFWPVTAILTVDHALDDACDPSDGAEDSDGGEDSDATAAQPIAPPFTKSATATYVWSASIGGYIEQSETISALEAELGLGDEEGDDEGDPEGTAE